MIFLFSLLIKCIEFNTPLYLNEISSGSLVTGLTILVASKTHTLYWSFSTLNLFIDETYYQAVVHVAIDVDVKACSA